MADQKMYYQNLDLDRERVLRLGFNFSGTPVSAEHAAYLKKEQRRAQLTVHQPDNGSSSGRQSSSPSDSGNTAFSKQHAIKNDGTIQFRDRNGPKEILPRNIWPMLLSFESNEQHIFRVMLDTGTEDNWISESVVSEYDLPWEDDEDDEETYLAFNGQTVKSCGVVRAHWIYWHQALPVKFKIAQGAPLQALFGYRHLLEAGVLTLNHDNTNRRVAPLIKSQQKPSAAAKERISSREDDIKVQAARIEDYRKWKDRMERDNWEWDTVQNNFFKVNERGEKQWCMDGYQIAFRRDDALQNNLN